MKNILGQFIIFGLFICNGYSQSSRSCCQLDPTQSFAALANNPDFVAAHLVPLPFSINSPQGEEVLIPLSNGTSAKAYLLKRNNSQKYLFVFHEWWGLNDYIKKESETIYSNFTDVNVIALDLYQGKVATSVPEAQQYMGGLTSEYGVMVIKGALEYIGPKAIITTIGWCMGGSWSLQAALLAGNQAKGCVIYYGMPEESVDKLKTLSCDVLGIFADQDKFISTQVVDNFKSNMKKAGKKLTVYTYAADHAFANPSNPKHNEEYSKDAMEKSLKFLKLNFEK